jgi:hypothetical protein
MVWEILLVMVLGAASGTACAALFSWSSQRRLLALEEYLKVREPHVDDRLKQIEKIAIREMKSDAAKARWSKREVEETALAAQLTNKAAQPDLLPWDPRTWGGN